MVSAVLAVVVADAAAEAEVVAFILAVVVWFSRSKREVIYKALPRVVVIVVARGQLRVPTPPR
jgi:hypothetical protein